MHLLNLKEVLTKQENSGKPYFEFIKASSLSMGIYVLDVGDKDLQNPHTEDEVYYIIEGKGKFFQEGEEVSIAKGSFLYVPAHDKHYFHSIEEKLTILVFFAPAEYTNAHDNQSVENKN